MSVETMPTPKAEEGATEAVPRSGTQIYTCPMHPEVRQDSPGACPKCGMALELETPTGPTDEAGSTELHDMTRRLWVGAVLALPVFLLAMAHLIPALGRKEWVTGETARWLQFALTTAWAFQWRLERSTRSSGCCSARSSPAPP